MARSIAVPPLTLFAVAVIAAGCYQPELGSTPFLCALQGKKCPDGYVCRELDKNNEKMQVCIADSDPRAKDDSGAPAADRSLIVTKDSKIFLDGATVNPSKGCKDKASEANNSLQTATDLTGRQGRLPGWEICYAGDVDHYRLSLKSGTLLQVKITFKHSDGDLELALLDAKGTIIEAAQSETDNESIERTITSTGDYAFAVYGYRQSIAPYGIELTYH